MDEFEFDAREIEGVFPAYKFETKLGKGSFGQAYLVSNRQTGSLSALKKIKCFGMNEYERNNSLNEIRILASMDHPNIIKFYNGMIDGNQHELYIFMEYASQGDLAMMIEQAKNSKKRIPEQQIWSFLLDMAEALEYLHKNLIIHRDIKPANIFRAEDGTHKLGDLNVSKIIKNGQFARTQAGSPLYVSPQVWKESQEGYNEKCDIWSLGIVAFEMCSLLVPYQANDIEELKCKQLKTKLKNIPVGYTPALNETIHEMLKVNVEKRLSASKLKAICLHNMKIDAKPMSRGEADALMETIIFPEAEQKWIMRPPKSVRRNSINSDERKDTSKDKPNDLYRSNIFAPIQNKSNIFIPKAQNQRVRLPSLKKHISEPQRSSKEKTREISKEKRQRSRRESKEINRETPLLKQN